MNRYTKIAESLLLNPVGTKMVVTLNSLDTSADLLSIRRGINRELATARKFLGIKRKEHLRLELDIENQTLGIYLEPNQQTEFNFEVIPP